MTLAQTHYRTGRDAAPVAPTSFGEGFGPAPAEVVSGAVGDQGTVRGPKDVDGRKVLQFRHGDHRARLELIDDEQRLMTLGREWDELFDAHGKTHQCFQNFAWNRLWCAYYLDQCIGDPCKLAIITARLDDELVLICPLVEYRRGGLLHLRWMGAPVSQYGDALMSDHPAAPDLLRAGLDFVGRITEADLLDLRKVRSDSAAARVLTKLGARALNEASAPYMSLASAADFDAYAQRYSARSRKQRRRRRRRLGELGALRFECLEPGTEASARAADTVAQKQASLRRTGAVATALEDARFEQFFRDFAKEPSRSATCLVSLLYCGNDVVAREIGLQCKDGYLAHVAVYDDAYARFGPGVLQIDDVMEQCYARGLATYDLLAPADEYKLALADGTVETCDYVRPLTWRGAMYAHSVLGFVRPLVRALKDRAPEPVRRVLGGLLPRLKEIVSGPASVPG
ncbi:MAG: GNAT family N-acetyltransferase [Hyphomicrobiaceae bacterium]|nr:GNAT family N-acetyltransferase [Hyphomicrobiaceae bacterium]